MKKYEILKWENQNIFSIFCNKESYKEFLYIIAKQNFITYFLIYDYLGNEIYFKEKVETLNYSKYKIYNDKSIYIFKIKNEKDKMYFIEEFLKFEDWAFHIMLSEDDIKDINYYKIQVKFDDIQELNLNDEVNICITNYWDTYSLTVYGRGAEELILKMKANSSFSSEE